MSANNAGFRDEKQMKRITTVITTYNHESFIAQAIESAICQKGAFEHEVLVSDNGSTDGTREIVRQYASRHPGLVKDVSYDVNQGLSKNLKKCFDLATGDYIAILEGDDYWTDEAKLDKQLKFLEEHPSCSMVFSRIRLNRDGVYSFLPRHDQLPTLISEPELLASEDMNPICNFSCSMFPARYIRSLPDFAYEGRLSEVTVAFYMVQIGPIGFVKESLSDYRIHANGVFSGASRQEQARQALKTFSTVRKIAGVACWPKITETVEQLKTLLCNEISPPVSIVTIAYNNLAGLKKTAKSVLGQSCSRFEWIVIDGGSTDGSKEFLASLERQPDHWVSEPDDGLYDAMNKGIRAAKGGYVIAMNAGDTFRSSDTLEAVLDCGLCADVVYGDWVRTYPDHEEFQKAPETLPPFFFFLERGNICHQAMFVRTSILKESPFDTRYSVVADWAKWRELMLAGCSFAYVPVTVCDFEATGGVSTTRASFRNVNDALLLRGSFPPGIIGESLKLCGVFPTAGRSANPFLRLVSRPLASMRVAHDRGGLVGAMRYAASLFLPFGLVRWWCEKTYGCTLDVPLFHYPGLVRRALRTVKFLCPYGLVCVFDVFAKGSGK